MLVRYHKGEGRATGHHFLLSKDDPFVANFLNDPCVGRVVTLKAIEQAAPAASSKI